ncbi:MAG TPA: M20/M25/M40 family metallo-hydrolase [Verrucomicrobiae bacterium]
MTTLAARTGEAAILRRIRARTRAPGFEKYLERLLVELCRIDTTPSPTIERMRLAEGSCFKIVERELGPLAGGGCLQPRPINPAIKNHPHFSQLHFTKTAERPAGLTAEEAYEGRTGLVYVLPGSGSRPGLSVALNAHVDVVAPYFPPRTSGRSVTGRGACDDKGPVVGVVAALKVLAEILAERQLKLNRNVVAMFVVEEETGGNGSLSLAVDRELKQLYESLLVCECTGLKVHPANRGAVWYQARLEAPAGASALELAAFVIEELEKEGSALRAESSHPLFPQRPVQTCHGIIGPYGEHPSRICGEVSFRIVVGREPGGSVEALVRDCLESGLATYVGLYGDKAKVTDPATGKPMVAQHYALHRSGIGFEVTVYGASGHMGSIRERDGAITKMAHLVRSLVYSKLRLESLAAGPVQIELASPARGLQSAARPQPPRRATSNPPQPPEANRPPVAPAELVLEGGQGFVPTHSLDEVMARMRHAAERGARNYLGTVGREERGGEVVTITYEKLHNVAYDGDPASPSMQNAIATARACGFWKEEPVLGWTVSCDARLFASEYPAMPVLTFGPGQLAFAHSDHEQIGLDEVRSAAEFLVLFILRQTGTL